MYLRAPSHVFGKNVTFDTDNDGITGKIGVLKL